jgi:Cellulase (glycosyl hydrolase family 5)
VSKLSKIAISRRVFALGAGAGLVGGCNLPSHASTKLEFVRKGEPIKGIGVVAPVENWAAASSGLTEPRIASLRAAGFNTLRIFVSQREFMVAQEPGAAAGLPEITKRWVDYVGHGVAAGFKAMVSWDSSYEERIAICGSGIDSERFRNALGALSRGLAGAFDPGRVALELMNEPPDETRLAELGSRSWSSVIAPLFFGDVRRAAPALTVVVQSAGGWSEAIPAFDPTAFDDNTMFCFHFYTPGEFTHQGVNYPDFYGVPFPITSYPGGKEAMLATILARLAADLQIDMAEKKRLSAKYHDAIDYLWFPDSPLGPRWVEWPKLDAWIQTNRIDPLRLLCGEFGVSSNFNFNGSPGADVVSRANYMRAVRQAVETHGFGGWIAHQAFGSFNLFEQTSISQPGDKLIPELADALFR